MGRRIIFSIWLAMLIAAAVACSQQDRLSSLSVSKQELYVTQLQSVNAFKGSVNKGAVSLKANLLGVLSSEGEVKLYSFPALEEKIMLAALSSRVNALSFSASGQTLALGTADGKIYLYNSTSGTNSKSLSITSKSISSLIFQDENRIFSANAYRTVIITDAMSGEALVTLPTFNEEITALAIQPGANCVAVGLSNGTVKIFSFDKVELKKTFIDSKNKISALCFSPDGTLLSAGTIDGNVYVWDAQSGNLKINYTQKRLIGSVTFDPKSQWIVTTAMDSSLKIYDLATMANVKNLNEQNGYVTYSAFLNEETLLTGTSAGMLKSWKVTTAPPDTISPGIVMEHPKPNAFSAKAYASEYKLRGLVFDDNELKEVTLNGKPLALTPLTAADTAKYLIGMKSAKRFNAVLKLDSIGFNRYEIKVTDDTKNFVVESGSIQRLSKDQAVEIETPLINSETPYLATSVRFRTWFDIASYSISVNMIDIVSGQIPEFKVAGDLITDEVPLVSGYNQIQLSVTSVSGERFSKTIGLNRKASVIGAGPSLAGGAKKDRGSSGPQKWAVVVGVSEYKNPGIPSLKYAHRDAEALANFLRRPEGGGYDDDHMRVLLNKEATLQNVRDALINFLNQAIDMDLVVIYFAGHGAPEPARPQNIYLLTHDSDPASLGTSAFPMWDIQTVLARYINAKRVIVFSDACHSGNISVNYATRGMGVTEQNLVNQYLADLSKSKEGVVVFTASASGEVSQEFPEMSHGVFTYYLLEGMEGKADYDNDYTVTINELMQYVEEQVKRKTRGAQNPTRSQTDYDKEMTISIISR